MENVLLQIGTKVTAAFIQWKEYRLGYADWQKDGVGYASFITGNLSDAHDEALTVSQDLANAIRALRLTVNPSGVTVNTSEEVYTSFETVLSLITSTGTFPAVSETLQAELQEYLQSTIPSAIDINTSQPDITIPITRYTAPAPQGVQHVMSAAVSPEPAVSKGCGCGGKKEVRLLLRNHQCPGDILMMTAAIRDLKAAHPEVKINTETTAWELWNNNPYLDASVTHATATKVLDIGYTTVIQSCNQRPVHFIDGFRIDLEEKLSIRIPQGPFNVDLHLTEEEKNFDLNTLTDGDVDLNNCNYWILNAGYKMDYPIKKWFASRYQRVIDHFKGKITFVQVGHFDNNQHHRHPQLDGVVNLVGKTDLNQLKSLMYKAPGVLTGVSMFAPMSSMCTPTGRLRPCVIIAGNREPAHYHLMPGQTWLANVGAYDCCSTGACWCNAGCKEDSPAIGDCYICKNQVQTDECGIMPRCMDDIKVYDVIRAIERASYGN